MSRIQHPQYREELEPTKYPFGDNALLTNGSQSLLEGTFLDATLYPVGGQARLRLSRVVVDHQQVTLYIGDDAEPLRASVSFDLISPPDNLTLVDSLGRPAGLLVSDSVRLGLFQSWGVGTYDFNADQTEFASTVCVPTPEIGLRGVLLEDGSLVSGDVWLVGDDGVVVRTETIEAGTANCDDGPRSLQTIRIDFVGDPLFRRRLCLPRDLFETPQFVTQLTLQHGDEQIVVTPDAYGDIKMTVNNDLAADTVLRLNPGDSGLMISAVGSRLTD